MGIIFLCVFLFTIILQGQIADTSITISHFGYSDNQGVPIILDEGGENSFFLDVHYPRILNDFRINQIIVDGALHLPQGSYNLPKFLSKEMAPDSINNYSQIHYRKGDYNSGELGLALEIEGVDSNYFILQSFSQSPPVIYSSSAWNDKLQNYLMSYGRIFEDETISLDVLYHLEDYHLPIIGGEEYHREVESFHGGLKYEKKKGKLWLDFHPAFQLTHSKHQDIPATYFTLWNNFYSRLYLGDKFIISIQQKYKLIMEEKDNQLNKFKMDISHPKLQYKSDGIILEGGVALYEGLYEPEGKFSWEYKCLSVAASREFYFHYEPDQMEKYKDIRYSLISLNIGYISKTINVILDIFQVQHTGGIQPGIHGKIEIDLAWLRLSQNMGIYNLKSDYDGPVDMFNHISLLFSPNIWKWRTARYQPFIGFEYFYLQHSSNSGIDPTQIPIIYMESDLESSTPHILNMEFGILVNQFKVSYRIAHSNILGDNLANSNITNPTQPVQQLSVVWQFWN